MWGAGCRVQGAGCRVQGARVGVEGVDLVPRAFHEQLSGEHKRQVLCRGVGSLNSSREVGSLNSSLESKNKKKKRRLGSGVWGFHCDLKLTEVPLLLWDNPTFDFCLGEQRS
jgi:hypothetical protein